MGSFARPSLARIAFIDRAIRAGGWPNAATLAKELEVSPRTVQRDIGFLRDRLQAPIEFDSRHNGYHLCQPDFRLPFFQLTKGELVGLFLAERLLQQYRGTYFEIQVKRWILSWGANPQVLEPEELRKLVRCEAEGILRGSENG